MNATAPSSRIMLGLLVAIGMMTIAHQAAPAPAATHRVTVGADGSFTPSSLRIREGDVVEWTLPARTTAIVAATSPPADGECPVPRAYVAGDRANFTGPMPFAPGGLFVMSPLERGFRVERGRCSAGPVLARAGDDALCATGTPFGAMESTWSDPQATGVFIRLLWNRTHIAPGSADASFDFTELDREVEQAVRHGKLYSLGFKAGVDGTPAWIFSTPPAAAAPGRGERGGRAGRGAARRGAGEPSTSTAAPAAATGGVTRLTFQDAMNGGGRGCGQQMDLGSPTDPMFQKHYFDLLTKVAAHLRARSDWYRALAYIKPSGANLISHENRLPNGCQAGCICNTQVFAEAGYTPARLYDFYRQQFALLAREFPDKPMSYALIQDGFPLATDAGGWEQANRQSSDGRPLPRGAVQTETILEIGQAAHKTRFVVQHNGLQPQPPAGTCPNENRHPARPPYAAVGTGCPNRWVLRAGADGDHVTGYQTNNAQGVSNPAELQSALSNAWVNSDASFVEVYEERFWEATRAGGAVPPGGRTLGQWADVFHERRRAMFRDLPDPFPRTHRHTFRRAGAGRSETVYYFDPSTCRAPGAQVGTIVIER
jgi:hypothetical protein